MKRKRRIKTSRSLVEHRMDKMLKEFVLGLEKAILQQKIQQLEMDKNVNEARLYTQKRIDELVMHANACINSLLEYSSEPRCSVIAEGTKEKEEDGTVPGYPSISAESKCIHKILHKRGYRCVSGMSSNGFGESIFCLEDDNESLEVIIKRSPKVVAQPQPDTIVVNDTEFEVADVKRYLLARGYKISAGSDEPEAFVHPKLNIKIAFC